MYMLTLNLQLMTKVKYHSDIDASDVPKTQTVAAKTKVKVTFDNSDLPLKSLRRWRDLFQPMWKDYAGANKDPWLCDDSLADAQKLWDRVFLDFDKQTLAVKNELIYYLVRFLVSPSLSTSTVTFISCPSANNAYMNGVHPSRQLQW